jgi:cytidylate kinase
VEADLRRRDMQDAERSAAPLRAAPDALLLDTTTLDIEGAFAAALALVRERLGRAGARRG